MNKLVSILIIVITSVLAGCATQVPVTKYVLFENVNKKKINKNVLVVIDDKLLSMKIEHKPIDMPGMMSYEFDVGESVRYTVMGVLGQKFQNVGLSNSVPKTGAHKHDYIVICELVKANINMGASVFSKHSADVGMRFTVLDSGLIKRLEVVEVASGDSSMTGGEMAYQLVPLEMWSQKNSFAASAARAWDIAILGSVGQFVAKLVEAQ